MRKSKTTRRELERAIEFAIAALDALDGDPDLEPETDLDNSEDSFDTARYRPQITRGVAINL